MPRYLFHAAILSVAAVFSAQAEQFAVQIDTAYNGASADLMKTLKVSEIESFSENGSHYVVLDAPNEAYVEAFFFAIGRTALELNVVDANWTTPAMQDLSTSQRLDFLQTVDCDFCAS